MKLGRFVKASADNLLFNIDYSQWLNSGETITGVPAFVVETDTSPTPLVIDGVSVINTVGPSGQLPQTMVAFHVSQGLTANTYTVTVTITTTQGQTKEDFVFFSVQDPP